ASPAALGRAAGARGTGWAGPGPRLVLQQPAIEEPVQGQPSDLAIHAKEMLRLRSLLTSMLARHTGQSTERITEDIERDTIFDAPAAKAYGLLDHVVQNRKTSLNTPRSPFGGR
ncbi:ATP-dependent Clp protease proteolytic subunit, partial [Streptomyces sp. NPDC055039]